MGKGGRGKGGKGRGKGGHAPTQKRKELRGLCKEIFEAHGHKQSVSQKGGGSSGLSRKAVRKNQRDEKKSRKRDFFDAAKPRAGAFSGGAKPPERNGGSSSENRRAAANSGASSSSSLKPKAGTKAGNRALFEKYGGGSSSSSGSKKSKNATGAGGGGIDDATLRMLAGLGGGGGDDLDQFGGEDDALEQELQYLEDQLGISGGDKKAMAKLQKEMGEDGFDDDIFSFCDDIMAFARQTKSKKKKGGSSKAAAGSDSEGESEDGAEEKAQPAKKKRRLQDLLEEQGEGGDADTSAGGGASSVGGRVRWNTGAAKDALAAARAELEDDEEEEEEESDVELEKDEDGNVKSYDIEALIRAQRALEEQQGSTAGGAKSSSSKEGAASDDEEEDEDDEEEEDSDEEVSDSEGAAEAARQAAASMASAGGADSSDDAEAEEEDDSAGEEEDSDEGSEGDSSQGESSPATMKAKAKSDAASKPATASSTAAVAASPAAAAGGAYVPPHLRRKMAEEAAKAASTGAAGRGGIDAESQRAVEAAMTKIRGLCNKLSEGNLDPVATEVCKQLRTLIQDGHASATDLAGPFADILVKAACENPHISVLVLCCYVAVCLACGWIVDLSFAKMVVTRLESRLRALVDRFGDSDRAVSETDVACEKNGIIFLSLLFYFDLLPSDVPFNIFRKLFEPHQNNATGGKSGEAAGSKKADSGGARSEALERAIDLALTTLRYSGKTLRASFVTDFRDILKFLLDLDIVKDMQAGQKKGQPAEAGGSQQTSEEGTARLAFLIRELEDLKNNKTAKGFAVMDRFNQTKTWIETCELLKSLKSRARIEFEHKFLFEQPSAAWLAAGSGAKKRKVKVDVGAEDDNGIKCSSEVGFLIFWSDARAPRRCAPSGSCIASFIRVERGPLVA